MSQKQLQFDSVLLKNYSRFNVEFIKGDGQYLYDTNGKEYLDFLSGIAVTGFGHNHPYIKSAVEEQLNNLWHVSNLFESSAQELLAAKLVKHSGLDSVFFCNSGTEANEAAIKFSRKFGEGRSTIISAIGGFHGRTMGSLSASAQFKLWEGFHPLTPGFVYVPFNDTESIKNSINEDTIAIMLEPIQGESGINVPDENYLKKVREICDKNNLLLILDEVQTGMGRTGKMFAYQWEDIKPDIVTLAKGISNGLPLGAVICSSKVAEKITPGSHGSTFGGNPVSIAAANAVVDLLSDNQLENIFSIGKKTKDLLNEINHQSIIEVRGKGLMIGIELDKNIKAKDLAAELLNEGVVVGTAGDNVIRILPPFIINDVDIMKFIQIFVSTLTKN